MIKEEELVSHLCVLYLVRFYKSNIYPSPWVSWLCQQIEGAVLHGRGRGWLSQLTLLGNCNSWHWSHSLPYGDSITNLHSVGGRSIVTFKVDIKKKRQLHIT